MDPWIMNFLSMLLMGAPVIIVQIVGAILAIVWRRRCPRATLCFCLAIALSLVTNVFTNFLYAWLPQRVLEGGGSSMELGTVFTVLGLARGIAIAIAWALVVVAVLIERPTVGEPE
ncbi:MAG: hypothetical protein K2R98_04345 [Gemmataceae bacterium]|nr:hypothetical protein [Gemmataceae bacterium]